MARFRMGARMKAILKTLHDAPAEDVLKGRCTQTYIIMRAEGLHPYRKHYTQVKDDAGVLQIVTIEKPHPPFVQQELASALADESISCFMHEFDKVRPQTDKLYATYSRSIKALLSGGYIKGKYVTRSTREPHRWFRSSYHLTDKGRQYLAENA